MKAVEEAHAKIEKASRLAKLSSQRWRRRRPKRRRPTYVSPLFNVFIEYEGFDVDVEKRIEQIAAVFGAEREGSGFSFMDGMRDISFVFTPRSEDERRAQGIPTKARYDHGTRQREYAAVDARRFVSTILGEVPEVVVCKVIAYAQFYRSV